MRLRTVFRLVTMSLVGLVPLIAPRASQSTPEDECARTARLQTYSNAVFVEEAGDVVGFDLAFQQRNGHSVTALLYEYQGVPNFRKGSDDERKLGATPNRGAIKKGSG
jgi:hypothetical protein